LAQLIPGHPLLGILKSGAELEERIQRIRFLASEHVDQPGAAGGSPEAADLGGELTVLRLSRLRDELLPSLDEVIGGEGVELVGCSVQIHGGR
jgi:hypothetical protein